MLLDLLLIVMLQLIVNERVLLHLIFLHEHLQVYDNVQHVVKNQFDIDCIMIDRYQIEYVNLIPIVVELLIHRWLFYMMQ